MEIMNKVNLPTKIQYLNQNYQYKDKYAKILKSRLLYQRKNNKMQLIINMLLTNK